MEKIPSPTTNEEEESLKRERAISDTYREMQEMGLTPISIMRAGGNPEEIRALETPQLNLSHPFAVFEVMTPDDPSTTHIYKTQLAKVPWGDLSREVLFYAQVLPRIKKLIPADIADQIEFPTLGQVYHDAEGETKGIVLFGLKGEILGEHDQKPGKQFFPEDLDRLIAIIKAVQNVNIQELTEASPEIKLQEKDLGAVEHAYIKKGEPRRKTLQKLLGDDALIKIDALLETSSQLQQNQPTRLLSEDVFTINLMRMPNGKLASFDWERLYLGKNPADDYGKIVSRLWNDEKMQHLLIRKILEANSDIPGFRDMFRANLLSREGSHFLKRYTILLEDATAHPENYQDKRAIVEEARQGQRAIKKMIEDILNNTGPWAVV